MTFFISSESYSKNCTSVYTQLCQLNKEWLNSKSDFPILNETTLLKTEQELIQIHLSLVEISLRNKNISHLTSSQKIKRNECLTILHSYWTTGIFPINLYHSERTPYFIDHLGTACAVGHIAIETGFGDLALQIQKENNFGYIYDLDKQYSLLGEWAFIHGFSIDELAWIQPSYGSCWSVSGSANNPTCNGFCDGSIELQIPVGGTPPYSISGPPCYMLCAGDYSYIITDVNGNIYTQTYTLVDPIPIDATLNWISDATSASICDGSASASNIGGAAPLTYYWFDCSGSPYGVNPQTINILCPGDCYVVINDAIGCSEVSDCITINDVSGVNENGSDLNYSIFPNPFSNSTTIQTLAPIDNGTLIIYNMYGQIVKQISAITGQTIFVSRDDLPNGLYFFRICEDEKIISEDKFLIVD